MLRSHYELSVGGRLGPAPNDDKEAQVLNRMVQGIETGLQYEAGPRRSRGFLRNLSSMVRE